MPRYHLDSSFLTDIGIKRELNEDNCFSASDKSGTREGIVGVFAVADGMGGHDAGDVASKIACEFLQHTFVRKGLAAFARELRIQENDYPALISESLRAIHQKIVDRAQSFNLFRTMGCTCLVGLIVHDSKNDATSLALGWVGDSRCYILRDKEILLATEDDSYVWDLYRKGEISYSEMRYHPKRNVVTQALGTSKVIAPHSNVVTLQPNDKILACTDGLHGAVTDHEMREVLISSPDAESAARNLVELANKAGGNDNISVTVMECLKEPRRALAVRPAKVSGLTKVAAATVLSCALAAVSYMNFVPATNATPHRPSAYHVRVFDIPGPVYVGRSVPVRFVVDPVTQIVSHRTDYAVVVAVDGQAPDTVGFAGMGAQVDNVYAVPVKFNDPMLHTVRVSLLRTADGSALCSDALVVVANEFPVVDKPKVAQAARRIQPAAAEPDAFIVVKGFDGKIQLKVPKDSQLDHDVNVAVASGGEEDVITLSRINRNVPKATMLDYEPGSRVSMHIVGSKRTYVQTMK